MNAKDIGLGWNLGNTLDAPIGETSWGMPFTTKEIVGAVRDMGFDMIRIPVSWHKHVTAAPEYVIDSDWLLRVKTVVDYALELGMRVIINSHHDNSVYMPTPANMERARTYLSAVWRQISAYFADYGEELIFQTMNEPRVERSPYEWWVDTNNKDCMDSLEVINVLNQAVVDVIRVSGGKNETRYILVSPYTANFVGATIDAFRLPDDKSERLMVSVHSYSPYDLCLNPSLEHTLFHEEKKDEIEEMMKTLNEKYVSRGIPVIIDEMGCVNKENGDVRYEWAKYFASVAKENSISFCWWDNGVVTTGTEGFGLLNRWDLTVYKQSRRALEGLLEGFGRQK